jgi:hypothetical protein
MLIIIEYSFGYDKDCQVIVDGVDQAAMFCFHMHDSNELREKTGSKSIQHVQMKRPRMLDGTPIDTPWCNSRTANHMFVEKYDYIIEWENDPETVMCKLLGPWNKMNTINTCDVRVILHGYYRAEPEIHTTIVGQFKLCHGNYAWCDMRGREFFAHLWQRATPKLCKAVNAYNRKNVK